MWCWPSVGWQARTWSVTQRQAAAQNKAGRGWICTAPTSPLPSAKQELAEARARRRRGRRRVGRGRRADGRRRRVGRGQRADGRHAATAHGERRPRGAVCRARVRLDRCSCRPPPCGAWAVHFNLHHIGTSIYPFLITII
jgi:hypothetical protein